MRKLLGFTLLELIISMVLLGILTSMFAPFAGEAIKNALQHYAIGGILGEGRVASLRLVRDLRSGQSVQTASASQIVFTDVNNNSITYSLSGAYLQRNSVNLSGDVSSLSFAYYDKTGAVTATLASVCYVKYTLGLTRNSLPYSFSSVIWLRNATCP